MGENDRFTPESGSQAEAEAEMKFELTSEERANGWTPETKADYMRRNLGVKPVYVGQ